MEVVANELRLGEGLRHYHSRPAMAASHIGNLAACGQPGHYPVECRQPVLHKVVEIARSEEPRSRTKQAGAIAAPGDPTTLLKCLLHPWWLGIRPRDHAIESPPHRHG